MQSEVPKSMLTEERRRWIVAELEREGKVVACELSRVLEVSEDTIRRDLRELAAEGRVQRVHGGALPAPRVSANYAVRAAQSTSTKTTLARAAATLVRPSNVVLVDGGTTNVEIMRHLAPDLHATVVTNSPPVAVALADHPHVEVIVLGGRMFKSSRATVDAVTLEGVRGVRADLCFLGVCSVHPETGVSTFDFSEAHIKRAMVASSAEVVAVALVEKLGTAAPYVVSPLSELTQLVTEATVSDEALAPYQAAGVTVLRA
ncbi:DeoR/GlpR family DNA-binding transcription regulator [Pendulispora rubella]|uniref:DeoR/GlpR family DNA-binding transcription regulator n=1 Tax=Pendulispora rubella TaxID=2741070 RepID=A0ABZ2KX27_9BACT